MKSIALADIAAWADGALIQGIPSDRVASLSTDSRRIEAGDLFVALRGENFDGHKFIEKAGEEGASAVVVSQLPAETEAFSGGIVRVKDTLAALQDVARHFRKTFPDLFAVGVTGSNGKTSTKDFLNAVLSAAGAVNCTAGNLNNHIGLPLTILKTDENDRFGVWEMGMNHPGEIEVLAEIAHPDAAVITNIGTAHIEHMGTREAIALEKSELARAIPEYGFCVMPADDDFFSFVADRVRCRMVSVGIETGDVQARNIKSDTEGRVTFDLCVGDEICQPVSLPVRGRHMTVNALLAAAVGLEKGISPEVIAESLSSVVLTGGRLQERVVNGVTFLDDSYNANPDSMRAALETLRGSEVAGRRIAVLGFMGELGPHEDQAYLDLGETASALELDMLLTVGERAARINESASTVAVNRNFDTHEAAAAFLQESLTPEDLVLVKGSRAAAMERVISALQ